MTSRYRHIFKLVFAIFALWLLYQGIHVYRITHPNRNHAMTESLKEMQTFCVGRFLIDLPKGTTIIQTYGSGGPAKYYAEYPIPQHEFERQIEERWVELQAKKTDSDGTPYVEPSKRISPMPNAVVFDFEHVILPGPDLHGVRNKPFHYTEGYLWRDETFYSLTMNDSDDAGIISTMQAIQPWQHDKIPAEAGFCGPYSFFRGSAKSEKIWIAFRLPTQPVIELRLDMSTVGEPYDGLESDRTPPHPDLKAWESDTIKVKTYRDAQRTVADLPGKEWLDGSTEFRHKKYYDTGFAAEWYTLGEINASSKPYIRAQFNISYQTDDPPLPWASFPAKKSPTDIGEEEFMAYWDTIMNSLRLRPGALPAGNR